MTLPFKLTNYVARALDLPGLFLGTFGDTTIEYMHSTHAISSWGARQNQCLMLKTNHGVYGVEILAGGNVLPLVKLPEADPLYDLLKKYRRFPDAEDYNESRLFSTLLFPGGVVAHEIINARNAPHPSPELDAQLEGMLMDIELKLGKPRNRLSEQTSLSSLSGSKGSFIECYRHLAAFGQSGLFGQPAAPHDTEYLLTVTLNNRLYSFVKTGQFFRGLREQIDTSNMLDLTEPDVIWRDLIEQATVTGTQPHNARLGHIQLWLPQEQAGGYFKMPDNDADVTELWHVLNALVAQFPE